MKKNKLVPVCVKNPSGGYFQGTVLKRNFQGQYWILREAKIKTKDDEVRVFALHLCRSVSKAEGLPHHIQFEWLSAIDQGRTFPSEPEALGYLGLK